MPHSVWSRAGAIGVLAVLIGCTSPQSSPPTSPLVATIAPVATEQPNAAVPSTVSGTVDAVKGSTLSISTNTGLKDVQLAEDEHIEQEGRGTLADLQPGLSVGITGKADGSSLTALSIRIFPAAVSTPRGGQFPMSGANQGNLMTNSVIEAFDGSSLTVTAAGQQYQFAVPPTTEIFKQVPATLGDLAPGKRVLVVGTPSADGSLRASSISVLGGTSQ
jgi:hypothetical protein